MASCIESYIWSNKDIIAYGYFGSVKNNKIIVGKVNAYFKMADDEPPEF